MQTTHKLRTMFFKSDEHPYYVYERKITSILRATDVLLDAGCGRTAPVLSKYRNRAAKLIGVDLEDYSEKLPDITLIQGDIANIQLDDESVDVVISRAVLEHVQNPDAVFNEIHRILKPKGHFIFLVPNFWDYVSIVSWLIPNKFHDWIMSKTERRRVEDTFPVFYRANTLRSIKKLSKQNGFCIVEFDYLGQYPSVFMFNAILFMIATSYEKTISKIRCLNFLRGWLLVHLRRM